MILRGKVHKFGDSVDTDAIISARYLSSTDVEELGRHCLEVLDEAFAERVQAGDVLLAGENFGCGSSREHAPLAIKGCGVSCVVAKSFARIFLRNAMNIGLPVFECPPAVDASSPGDELEVDAEAGKIVNLTRGGEFSVPPLPEFLREIVARGGLVNYIRSRLEKGGSGPSA